MATKKTLTALLRLNNWGKY